MNKYTISCFAFLFILIIILARDVFSLNMQREKDQQQYLTTISEINDKLETINIRIELEVNKNKIENIKLRKDFDKQKENVGFVANTIVTMNTNFEEELFSVNNRITDIRDFMISKINELKNETLKAVNDGIKTMEINIIDYLKRNQNQ